MNKIIMKDTTIYAYQEDIDININSSCNVEIYHYLIDKDVKINVFLNAENSSVTYYFNNINYNDHKIEINIKHNNKNTSSNIYNHGVNVLNNKLKYIVNGIIPKESNLSVCNQENQIINIKNGKSIICPNLLIDCFDTISNHSAYIGKFSQDKIFYLESRGLSKKDAYHLLILGFLKIKKQENIKKDAKNFLDEINKI